MSKQNYYKDVGLTEVSSPKHIKEAYANFLNGPQTDKKQVAAFEVLIDTKKREAHDLEPHIAKIREDINVKPLNALGGARTVGKVQGGLAYKIAVLQGTTLSPEQQKGSTSPRGVSDVVNSRAASPVESVQADEINSRSASPVGTKKNKQVVGNESTTKTRTNRVNSIAASPMQLTQNRAENAANAKKNTKEIEVYAKINAARSFVSKMRRGFSSTIALSAKEELMKAAMMTKSIDQIKNMNKKDMAELSKSSIKIRDSGGRGGR